MTKVNARGRSVGDILEVRIEKLVWGGSGLARTDSGVIFVDFAAPDDLLEVEITDLARDYARAKIRKIVSASPLRIQPQCPVFGRCGGCDWQHLSLATQLETKRNLLRELFQRKLSFSNIPEVLESPQSWGYRNRIQVHQDENGTYFHGKRTHNPVYIQTCPLAEPFLNEQLQAWPRLSAGEPVRRFQLSRQPSDESPGDDLWNTEFSQVNTDQNKNLREWVLRWASETQFSRFFDLYSGAGNFAFPLAESFPESPGVAVELHPGSVRSGQLEVQKRKWPRSRLQFFASSVDAFLPRLPIDEQSLLLLDPPRAGLGKTVSSLLSQTRAASLLYISCDPNTLVRDLEMITSTGLWSVHRVQAFDMFPQTAHLEVLVELRPVEKAH